MPLDVRTIIALTAVSAVLLNLGLIATARMSSGRVKGAERWATARGGEALGWVLLGLRGMVPDIVSMAVANTLLLLAAAMYHHALGEFDDGARDDDARGDRPRVAVSVALVVLTLGFLLLCNERLNRDALRLATRDALTGAPNRRAIEEVARDELARCRRSGLPLAVLLLDLDHFKAINDTYGHATGDAALRAFVATATAQLRARDTLGRYGGEEFLVVLPATTCEDARATAERLRAAVAGTTLEAGEHRLRVTTSIGVAEAAGNDDIDAMLARADTALYQAKAQGRNRTALTSPIATRRRDDRCG